MKPFSCGACRARRKDRVKNQLKPTSEMVFFPLSSLWIVFIAQFGCSTFSPAHISSIEDSLRRKGVRTFRAKPFSARGRALQTDQPVHFNTKSSLPLLEKHLKRALGKSQTSIYRIPPPQENIVSAGERGVHAEGQHDGEDHRLWDGEGAGTRDGHQGALRDPRVCCS